MKLEESVVIDASPISLFHLTQDYEHRLEWDPFLQSATLVGVGAQEAGLGVEAVCCREEWVGNGDGVCLVQPTTRHGREDDPRPLVPG